MPDETSQMILRIMVASLILLASAVTALSCPLKACELANPLVITRAPHIHRRDLLISLAVVGIPISVLKPARAELVGEGEQRMVLRQKPTAPVGALLPAIQQRLLLEAALKLVSSSWDESSKQELQSILPPLDEQSSKLGTKQDVRVLKRYNPAKILRGDLTRAAMNLYTTNLNYNNLRRNPNDAYSITDPKWKKSYIRANDGLPDIQKVIGADLDLRNLYRNQVELNMDDAAAELYATDCNQEELRNLLTGATEAFDQWLDRIRYGDVRDALEAALTGQTTHVYDSWAAGFIPPQTGEGS